MPPSIRRRETIESITRQAEEAQSKAEARIAELTNALKNSEILRAETEDLVTALEKRAIQSSDISSDPRFIELQQEMLALQNDLISIQEMADPRVKDLEAKLMDSKSQSTRLKNELDGVINEFSGLKVVLMPWRMKTNVCGKSLLLMPAHRQIQWVKICNARLMP